MSDTPASLSRKIGGASDLKSVVRSMKTLAAAGIGQYEKSVQSLADYYRSVELGLMVCLRNRAAAEKPARTNSAAQPFVAVVFGSDLGLVGRFNDVLAEFAVRALNAIPGPKQVWAVGERIGARLADAGLAPLGSFPIPASIDAVTPLVGRLLVECEAHRGPGEIARLELFHHRPKSGTVSEPIRQPLLPLDAHWALRFAHIAWPTQNLPEAIGDPEQTLRALVREYLFVSLFQACAESLVSENASRLAAMQRAEKNIDERVTDLNQTFRRLRQSSIDEELFDVLAGYESLSKEKPPRT